MKEFVESCSRGGYIFHNSFIYIAHVGTGEKPVALDRSLIDAEPGHELRTPLLVWIDDRLNNNAYEVARARGMGIYAIEMTSTAMAKARVDANLCKLAFPF